jgi:predicted ATP-binding protein involved in virulence
VLIDIYIYIYIYNCNPKLGVKEGRQVKGGFKMYVDKIRMTNFKCFEEYEIIFNSRFNLIVGDKGLGKTTILEAISIGISGYLNEVKSLAHSDRKNIASSDVRIKRNNASELAEFKSIFPAEINLEVTLNGEKERYSRIKKSKGASTVFSPDDNIRKISNNINSILENGIKEILPVFAYHGTGRAWGKLNMKNKGYEINSRVLGYKNCINPASNENQYTKWIKEMRMYEIDEGVDSVELRTVYKAAEKFLGVGSKVRYIVKENEIIITLPKGNIMPFSKLSDGYKNALGMILDMAFRMVKLNPWLKENAIEETMGIMLIDEIELHLHPSWQRRIIEGIKNTFPKIQIVATTIGAFVVASCNKDELIILNSELADDFNSIITVQG